MNYSDKFIDKVKEEVKRNEMRELSIAEERDPVEVIPNFHDYAHNLNEKDEYACEDCDFVGKNGRALAAHRRVHE